MAQESTIESLHKFLREHAQLIEWAHVEGQCDRWGLSCQTFAEVLYRSAENRFKHQPVTADEIEAYIRALHLDDLALACACSEGVAAAWEFFIAEFRAELHRAARAILHASGSADSASAEELADSLYAELYGISSSGETRRKSLFDYFHGRSKLSTWLRAILAQRHIDLLRGGKRVVVLENPLDIGEHAGRLGGSVAAGRRTEAAPADPNREEYISRLDDSLRLALANLAARERMLLACYYLDRLTLAEIGRIVHEHESTVSRQLDRIRQQLRESVTEILRVGSPAWNGVAARPGMSEAQVELTFEYAMTDWPFDLARALSDGGGNTANRPDE